MEGIVIVESSRRKNGSLRFVDLENFCGLNGLAAVLSSRGVQTKLASSSTRVGCKEGTTALEPQLIAGSWKYCSEFF
jgi:hypothetical protein